MKYKYNTAFDVGFSIDHNYDNPEHIPLQDLLNALADRISEIRNEGALEVFGILDTYETEDGDQDLKNNVSPDGYIQLDLF